MITWLSAHNDLFPDPQLTDENGVIAIGGDLSTTRLLNAYLQGVFPWYNPGEPIIWHCPNPRFVLVPQDLHISKNMAKMLRKESYSVTFNKDFRSVISTCRNINRKGDSNLSWITDEMEEGYINLHNRGYAHSVEVWEGETLIGGLYGIALGNIFYGESMFSTKDNASKYGFITLVHKLKEKGFVLVDCQQETQHLKSLGAISIPRKQFLEILKLHANKSKTLL